MTETGAKSRAFFKAITDASRSHSDSIIKETESHKLRQLEKAKAEAQQLYDEYVFAATEKMTVADSVEAQSLSFKLKKQIIAVRQEITDSVFSLAEEKIKAFTLTESYAQMLCESAKKMVEICGESAIVIYLRSEDKQHEDAIKAISGTITTEIDDSITLGGIYCICREKSIALNDSLQAKLENQKEWFYENSGLHLR